MYGAMTCIDTNCIFGLFTFVGLMLPSGYKGVYDSRW
jgi:hypothetical protein